MGSQKLGAPDIGKVCFPKLVATCVCEKLVATKCSRIGERRQHKDCSNLHENAILTVRPKHHFPSSQKNTKIHVTQTLCRKMLNGFAEFPSYHMIFMCFQCRSRSTKFFTNKKKRLACCICASKRISRKRWAWAFRNEKRGQQGVISAIFFADYFHILKRNS